MILTPRLRRDLVDILTQLTDPEDIRLCTEALMDAQGYRSLVRAASFGESEEAYLKRLRAASRSVGNSIPNCESVLNAFEILVTEMEEDLSAN
jgi:hypothetical protein